MDKAQDIYFDSRYGKLYEDIENGEAIVFFFASSNGKICTQFIKRKLPFLIGGRQYYDIVTPYGYGGPVIEEAIQKEDLLTEFYERFKAYCEEENIISEFIRFYPLFGNQKDFQSRYETVYLHKTVGTNLAAYAEPVQEEFSKACKRNIKQAMRKGVTYRIIEKPENIDSFIRIYYATMDRNAADDYYYFGQLYFKKCLESFQDNIVLVEALFEEKVIAASFYFVYGEQIHLHLAGSLSEYLYLSPSYVIQYAITLWGKEHKYSVVHLGGGKSNAKDDSLYLFKKRFGKNTEFDFFVGKKIWNEEVYEKAVEQREEELGYKIETEYFPKYRWKKK